MRGLRGPNAVSRVEEASSKESERVLSRHQRVSGEIAVAWDRQKKAKIATQSHVVNLQLMLVTPGPWNHSKIH